MGTDMFSRVKQYSLHLCFLYFICTNCYSPALFSAIIITKKSFFPLFLTFNHTFFPKGGPYELNPCCMNCQLRKQEAKIRHFDDEDRKKQYMEAIRRRFDNPKEGDCVPSISTELKKFYCSFWGVPMEDFSQINREYDQLMLDLEEELRSTIRYSADPLKTALIYARTGNYIDFAALPEVSQETALALIKSENKDTLDEQEYKTLPGYEKSCQCCIYYR